MATQLVVGAMYEFTVQALSSGQLVDNVYFFKCLQGTAPPLIVDTIEEAIDRWYQLRWEGRMRSLMPQEYVMIQMTAKQISQITLVPASSPARYLFSFAAVAVRPPNPMTAAGTNMMSSALPTTQTVSVWQGGSVGGVPVRGGKHFGPITEADVGVAADQNKLSTTAQTNWQLMADDLRLNIATNGGMSYNEWQPSLIRRSLAAAGMDPSLGAAEISFSLVRPRVGTQQSRKARVSGL